MVLRKRRTIQMTPRASYICFDSVRSNSRPFLKCLTWYFVCSCEPLLSPTKKDVAVFFRDIFLRFNVRSHFFITQKRERDGSFLEIETLEKEKKADDVQGRHISKNTQHLQKHIQHLETSTHSLWYIYLIWEIYDKCRKLISNLPTNQFQRWARASVDFRHKLRVLSVFHRANV